MSKKLFIGGISWSVTQNDLINKFESYGEVSDAKLITDHATGRSRGFGFVTFEDPSAGDRAISELDGQEWEGRTIKVSEAQERQKRPPMNNNNNNYNRW